MTAPQPGLSGATTRRGFLGLVGAGGAVLLGGVGLTAAGCGGDGADGSPSAVTDPADSEVNVVPVLPQLADDDPLRHWSSLSTRDVLGFGRKVADIDAGAAAHAIDRLAGTPDAADPGVAMRALDEACTADIAAGELVTVDTWTLPRTLAGLAAGLAAAE